MLKDRPIEVTFFRLDSGREPVREWLQGMIAKNRKIIGEDVRTLQFGWPVGMPLARKMDANLWELRSTLAGGIARVFFHDLWRSNCPVAWICEEVTENASKRIIFGETSIK